jgi:hypothetical protein
MMDDPGKMRFRESKKRFRKVRALESPAGGTANHLTIPGTFIAWSMESVWLH